MDRIQDMGRFAPSFYAPPRLAEAGASDPLAAEQGAPIHYDFKTHGSQSAFETSPLFTSFTEQFEQCINVLDKFAIDNVKDTHTLATIRKNLLTFKARLQRKDYGGDGYLIYGQGKQALDTICRLLECAKIPLDSRIAVILDLSAEVHECAGGCLTGLTHAVSTLQQAAGGIEGSVLNWKAKIVEQDILQYVKRNFPECLWGDEVHYGNAFANHMSGVLGLPKIDDPLARMIPSDHLDRCQELVLGGLTPVRLALGMAESCLAQVEALPLAAYQTTKGLTHTQALGLLGGDLMLPISAQFGEVGMNLLMHESETEGAYDIGGPVYLIARAILATMQQHGLLPELPQGPAINPKRGEGAVPIMQSAHGALFWVDASGDVEPLQFEHLATLDRRDFAGGNTEATYLAVLLQIITTMPRERLPEMPHGRLDEIGCIKAFLARWDTWSALERYVAQATGLDKSLELHRNELGDFILDESHSQLVPLLKGSKLVERADAEGNRPLARYAASGASAMVDALLAIDANPNAVNAEQRTPLMQAIICRHRAVVTTLSRVPALAIEQKDHAGYTALLLAAFFGNAEFVKLLLLAGADRNAVDGKGRTALMWAASHGKADVAALLLEDPAAIELDAFHAEGCTALMHAVMRNDLAMMRMLIDAGASLDVWKEGGKRALEHAFASLRLEAFELLLDRGADRNYLDVRGQSLLMRFAQVKADAALVWLGMLLKGGANLDFQEGNGKTALMIAIDAGCIKAAEALIRHGAICNNGASLSIRDVNGWTAVMRAAIQKDVSLLKMLVDAGANLDVQDNQSATALMHAATNGAMDAMTVLVQGGANPDFICFAGWTAMRLAVEKRNVLMADMLTRYQASYDIAADDGITPWMRAVGNGMALPLAAIAGRVDLVRQLLGTGADRNAADVNGVTALMQAAKRGDLVMLQMLIDAGANLDLRDENGMTALMYAVREGRNEVAQALIDGRANPDIVDSLGRTAVMLAIQRDQGSPMVEMLAKARANLDLQDHDGKTALMLSADVGSVELVSILLKYGASIDLRDNKGWTAMRLAVEKRNVLMADMLKDYKASYAIAAGDGITPWARALGNGMALPLAAIAGSVDLVRHLLGTGADRNAADVDGVTVLMQTAQCGNLVMLQMLIDAGANLDLRDENGMTALMFAVSEGHNEVAQALIDGGANLDIVDSQDRTAVMLATQCDHGSAMVEMLAKAGANLDLQGYDGETALMLSADDGSVELVSILLEYGASVDLRDHNGWTAMRRALSGRQVDIAIDLRKFSADPQRADLEGITPLAFAKSNGTALLFAAAAGDLDAMKTLLAEDFDLEAQCALGCTALINALRCENAEAIDLLVSAGANLDHGAGTGPTPLSWMVELGSLFGIAELIGRGADINARDGNGATPLILAAGNGNLRMVRLLLEAQPDLDAVDQDGKTAYDLAMARPELAELEPRLRPARVSEFDAHTTARRNLARTHAPSPSP